MTDASFDVVLSLTVEVSRGLVTLDDLRRADWRSGLRPVATREPLVQLWEPERLPSDEEARALLDRVLGSHPMGNVGARPVAGGVDRKGRPQVLAVVVAEVLVQQDLAPISEGADYPDSLEGPLAEPRVVHARPWAHGKGSEQERLAADELLEELTAGLPAGLSIPG